MEVCINMFLTMLLLEMITEYKIIPVNGNNEKINLFEEIFDNQQEQELEDELEFYIDLG